VEIASDSLVPKHRQVYGILREAILDGRMESNSRLPSSRELARSLGVSRNTVLASYELLLGEGYAVSLGGSGTFVAPDAMRTLRPDESAAQEPRALSALADELRVWRAPISSNPARAFRPASPAVDLFPYALWSRVLAHTVRDGGFMTDGDVAGYGVLREQIAHHLRAFRSCRCSADQVIITTGSQMAHALCAMVLIDPGDAVWFEEPGYPEARLAYRAQTSRIIPVPVDDDGIDIAAGKAISPKPRLICTTPTHQWPLGSYMPVQRRLALLEFAVTCNAWIVEDDYDSDLRFDGKSYSAMQGLDETHRVIHVGSFSKALYPGLRLGYAVVPQDIIDAFTAGRAMLDRFPNTTAQIATAEFMERGHYAKHLRSMQEAYAERHELLSARIESKLGASLVVRPVAAGTFSVAELSVGLDDAALARNLAHEGIESIALSATYTGPVRRNGLILGHAIATPEAIRTGVDTIARLVSARGAA
jgi:GntR family transcriptional regulator / MocR family aminotransferase